MNKHIKQGDIYYANLGRNRGSIQSGMRPVVVYQNDIGNKYSPIVNVYSITSQDKAKVPTHVKIGKECGLEKDSIVMIEQVFTLNQSDLIGYVGSCTDDVYKKICKAVKIQHGWISPRFDERYIRERQNKISKLNAFIEKYENMSLDTSVTEYERIALMGEIITYCKNFDIDPKNYLEDNSNNCDKVAV